jgi:uracil-DNA glycosylase
MYLPYVPAPAPITDLWYGTTGPRDARIALVGESWGASESYTKKAFQGAAGQELDRILHESGLSRDAIFCTNCFAAQPPQNEAWRFFETSKSGAAKWKGLHPTPWALSELHRLSQQLAQVKPTLVIAAGNYALWALTEEGLVSFGSESTGDGATVLVPSGISSWRGSMLVSMAPEFAPEQKVLPIYHPSAILRAWYNRDVTIHDLSARVPLALSGDWRPSPPPTIHAPPSFETARRVLENWYIHAATGSVLRLSNDIETARGVITCLGLADGPYKAGSTALVLPLVRPLPDGSFENFWTAEEEFILTRLFLLLLRHPNVRIEGQNYNYDAQWIEAFYAYFPRVDFDTMLAHHLLWPGTPKALDYISSLYNHYYRYWKDDNKDWDLKGNFVQHLIYNGEDCLRTYECATELRLQLEAQGFTALWEIEKEKNDLALDMMRRGIAVDRPRRAEMGFNLAFEKGRINEWLRSLMPQSFLGDLAPKSSKKSWWDSPHQQRTLFYDILGLPVQKNRKTGSVTVDAEAIEKLRGVAPEYERIWSALELQRSISVFHNTFIKAELEPVTYRAKSSFNTAGTETFRWSSSTNAFWRGMNMQNIPKGEERE